MEAVLRSLISVVLAGSFALSAFGGGAMPGCAVPEQTPGVHSAAGHQGSHEHSSPGRTLVPQQCLVHLCCMQVTTVSPVATISLRLSEPARASGFLAKGRVVDAPSHTLPFAHAPPRSAA
jgi:hypothetical protein